MLNTDEKRSFRNINSKAFEEDLKRNNWIEALTLSDLKKILTRHLKLFSI